MDRRGFFKLVTASGAAAATATGCTRAPEAILPYVVPPEHLVPGVASWFATVCRECPGGCGIVARTREGRVVKVEGNPDHPVNRGALCARGQASILGTYDPDRVGRPRSRDGGAWKTVTVEEAEKLLTEKLQAARAKGPGRIALISQTEAGTLGRLMDEWLKAVGGRPRVAFEPFGLDALRSAHRAVFGLDVVPHYVFEDAKAILSLGADYLETWVSPVGFAGAFRRAHTLKDGAAARAFHVEPRYSMTAASADEWIENAPGTEGLVASALLRIVLDERWHPPLPAKEAEALSALTRPVDLEAVAKASGVPVARLRGVAEHLAKHAPSLVVGGPAAGSGAGAVEGLQAVALLNYVLGNVGKTVRFDAPHALSRSSRVADLLTLGKAMAQGEIDVLLVKDANPVYALPPKAGFADALAKVPFVVSLSTRLDETAEKAHLVLPDLSPLESWGDYEARAGVVGLMQPAMAPVPRVGRRRQDALDLLTKDPGETFEGVETKATGDLLLSTGKALVPGSEKTVFQAATFADHLRAAWQALAKTAAPGQPFETFWEAALQRGGLWGETAVTPPAKIALQPGLAPAKGGVALEGPADGLALLVTPSSRFYDGRSTSLAWLHEAPDPMTQVVYGSWVEVATSTAARLGVHPGDVVTVTSPHGSVEAPAYVSETLRADAVAISSGLGHTAQGRYARGIGVNPVGLLSGEADPASGGLRWLGVRVTLTRTGRREKLASPAGVTEVDHERDILETISLKDAVAAESGKAPAREGHGHGVSMYPDLKYPEHRWGMAIDLDSCTGCQACVVACQAENNVPLVGKKDIDYGRSLHWLRVERWWDRGAAAGGGHAGAGGLGVREASAATPPAGEARRPAARFLPMLCQHCEVAPCEPVCPVFAAYHTSEGLNGQVYNRCVGTRYCGNNCPYMVRRFNWWRYDWPAPMTLALNPDVTVRDRGVMEKCTMCVQRIVAGKDRAKDEGRRPRDGEIMTACQQTCPSQAITFGDLKDDRSRVSRLAASGRGYHVLGELGTRPAITYLKAILREEHA